jgi:hypothetical protein
MTSAAVEAATGMHAAATESATSAATATAASAATGIGIIGNEACRQQNDHCKAGEKIPKHGASLPLGAF